MELEDPFSDDTVYDGGMLLLTRNATFTTPTSSQARPIEEAPDNVQQQIIEMMLEDIRPRTDLNLKMDFLLSQNNPHARIQEGSQPFVHQGQVSVHFYAYVYGTLNVTVLGETGFSNALLHKFVVADCNNVQSTDTKAAGPYRQFTHSDLGNAALHTITLSR